MRRARVSEEVSNNQNSQGINQEENPNEGHGDRGLNSRDQQPKNPLNMLMEFLQQYMKFVPE